jgi:poly(glycerol-phosphate) alpha-glucosyltransferase
MKIGIITDCLSRRSGGVLDAVRGQSVALAADGVGLRVFGIRDADTATDLRRWEPLQPVVCGPRGPAFFNFAPALPSGLRAYDPDLIEVHGLWKYTSVAALQWQRSSKRPRLVHPHGMLDPWALKNSGWKKKIAYAAYEKSHLQNASCIRALGAPEALAIRETGLEIPIAVVPNGIDLPPNTDSASAPWEGRTAGGRKVLLYLGRIHPKKNLAELLRAWAEVAHSVHANEEWVLVVCGWDQGGHEAELQKLASELNLDWADLRTGTTDLNVSVLFAGPQFDQAKLAAYYHCEAFILPSVSEGLPMVILEAWAHRKTILMTPECNLPEGITAGAALEIKSDAMSIADGLGKLFALSNKERSRIGNNGRQLVEERFTWAQVAAQMQSVYAWILGCGGKPGCVQDI